MRIEERIGKKEWTKRQINTRKEKRKEKVKEEKVNTEK